MRKPLTLCLCFQGRSTGSPLITLLCLSAGGINSRAQAGGGFCSVEPTGERSGFLSCHITQTYFFLRKNINIYQNTERPLNSPSYLAGVLFCSSASCHHTAPALPHLCIISPPMQIINNPQAELFFNSKHSCIPPVGLVGCIPVLLAGMWPR